MRCAGVLLVVLLILSGCKDGADETRCTPGETLDCSCAGGARGLRTCRDSGQSWSPCACGDADVDVDLDGDSDSDADADADTDTDTDTGDWPLVAAASWEVPVFGTGVDSVFTDLFVPSASKLYLINDGQHCDVVVAGGTPSFASPTFCAASQPGWTLRGWAAHGGTDFVVNQQTRTITSGRGADLPLPADLVDPSGLASDGARFWVSDAGSGVLFGVDPSGGAVTRLVLPGDRADSVSWDGERLWVLDRRSVHLLDRAGRRVGGYTLDVSLSGISVRGTAAWGAGAGTDRIYRFDVP